MGLGLRIATSPFGQFMATGPGRLARIVVGGALVVWGLIMGGTGGIVLALVGLIPLMAGAFGVCLLTGLTGGLWTGEQVLDAAREHDVPTH